MHRYRVRHLAPGPRSYVKAPFNSFQTGVNAAAATCEVEAHDELLSEEEIAQRLRDHSLRSTDLVHVEGCWMSLIDFLPVGDAAIAAQRREERLRFLSAAGLFGLVVLGSAARLFIDLYFRVR